MGKTSVCLSLFHGQSFTSFPGEVRAHCTDLWRAPLPPPPPPIRARLKHVAVADKSFLGELYRAVNRSAFQRDARKARMEGMAQERAAKHEKESMHELGMEEFAVAMRTLSTHLRRWESLAIFVC
jgi:SpoVK/Ycf46/Vps4 family AAA+-type ATPase